MNIIEKTKDAIDSKLNEFFEDLTKKNLPNKCNYYDLLKKNVTKTFYFDNASPNINWSNMSSDFEFKARPETAKPSNLKILDNFLESARKSEEGKNHNNYKVNTMMSFCGIKNSMNASPEDSLPSSPTFHPDKKRRNENKDKILSESEFYTKADSNNKLNINLTKFVWPKSRTLLSIISKMFLENYINEKQRGLLKELIMDHDESLLNILHEYEVGGNCIKLYECIKNLANEKLKFNI
jgi:hypothetical protein